MNQEKFNFTKHSYLENLSDMMKNLIKSSDFADVTLVCEDKKQIKAHRNILSACSPVFKDILQIDKSFSSIIFLKGVMSSKMQAILEYIYLGEATIYQEQINEFLSVANSLEIKDLAKDWETERASFTGEGAEIVEHYSLCADEDESIVNEKISEHEPDSETFSKEKIKRENNDNGPFYLNSNVKIKDEGKCQVINKVGEMIGERIKCDKCHLTFTARSSMNQHKRNIHEGKKYPCHHCDYQATQNGTLLRHIRAKHTPTGLYS